MITANVQAMLQLCFIIERLVQIIKKNLCLRSLSKSPWKQTARDDLA